MTVDQVRQLKQLQEEAQWNIQHLLGPHLYCLNFS